MTLLEIVKYLKENGIILEWRDDPVAIDGGIVWPTSTSAAFFEETAFDAFMMCQGALIDAHWQTHERVSA